MTIVEQIQFIPVQNRIAFLNANLETLEQCDESELNLLGRFACHESKKMYRDMWPIIGDIKDSEFDLQVFGDPDYPDDPLANGKFVSLTDYKEKFNDE